VTSPTTTTTAAGAAVASPDLAEQAHALHQAADLLTQAGLAGLTLTFNDDKITIQVGAELGEPADRTAMVTHLAAIVGTRSRRWGGTGPTANWLIADGLWAGHLVHIFTAIGDHHS
jgi:hypothetical protein